MNDIICSQCWWRVVNFQPGIKIYRCRKRNDEIVAMCLVPSQETLKCPPDEDCFEPVKFVKPWERSWCKQNKS